MTNTKYPKVALPIYVTTFTAAFIGFSILAFNNNTGMRDLPVLYVFAAALFCLVTVYSWSRMFGCKTTPPDEALVVNTTTTPSGSEIMPCGHARVTSGSAVRANEIILQPSDLDCPTYGSLFGESAITLKTAFSKSQEEPPPTYSEALNVV